MPKRNRKLTQDAIIMLAYYRVIQQRWRFILFMGLLAGGLMYVMHLPRFHAEEYMCETMLTLPPLHKLKNESLAYRYRKAKKYSVRFDLKRYTSMLQSDSTRNKIAQEFDLYENFGVKNIKDPDLKATYFREAYEDLIRVHPSKSEIGESNGGMLRFLIYNKDPILARKIAVRLGYYADSLIKSNAGCEQVKIGYAEIIDSMRQQCNIVQDSLNYLQKKYRLYNLNFMSEVHAKLIGLRPTQDIKFMENYATMQSLHERARELAHHLQDLVAEQQAYNTYLSEINYDVPNIQHVNVLREVYRPYTWIYTGIFFTLGTLLTTVLCILVTTYKQSHLHKSE